MERPTDDMNQEKDELEKSQRLDWCRPNGGMPIQAIEYLNFQMALKIPHNMHQ